MNSTELRIGNWVNLCFHHKEGWFAAKVTAIHSDKTIDTDHEDIGNGKYYFEGVPLTEQCLIKMGFETDKYPNYLSYSKWVGDFKLVYKILAKSRLVEFWLEGNGQYDEQGETDLTDMCKYVHQLQNLYFSLTGTELPSPQTSDSQ